MGLLIRETLVAKRAAHCRASPHVVDTSSAPVIASLVSRQRRALDQPGVAAAIEVEVDAGDERRLGAAQERARGTELTG